MFSRPGTRAGGSDGPMFRKEDAAGSKMDGSEKSKTDDDENDEDLEMLREMLKQMKSKYKPEDNARGDSTKCNDDLSRKVDTVDATAVKTVPSISKKKETIIKLTDVEQKSQWAFEVKTPITKPLTDLIPNPAKTWPFELDSFQKQAIVHLEDGNNVFVAAHTSAGKTVVAEYAIAMAERQQGRVIYTSPIKALSNQKYSDFRTIFKDVGLITGDIQVNDNARCLIMTTEILRSKLYTDNPTVRDLQFVIFDEVHYINDPERGHVWEEVLILLPHEVQIVMLSATVPNAMQFANWLGHAKQRPVAVSRTAWRPVPLHYYLYVGEGNKVIKIKEEDNFLFQNYKFIKEECEKVKDSVNYKVMKFFWNKLIAYLKKEQWTPTVVFALSRKKCDTLAEKCSSIDLTDAKEKHKIEVFVNSQIKKLNDEDQDLNQIVNLKKYLVNGIGIHHSGILPILKEVVEVLFSKGLVKVLFATETFAVGVNMPAKTVVFEDVNKFDGVSKRLLLPAEFIQMAGRAGRRGRDDTGTVIILSGYKIVPEHELRSMMMGTPSALSSQFRLTYSMILNTLRNKGELTIEHILTKSYLEHGEQSKKFKYESQLENKRKVEEEMGKFLHDMYHAGSIDLFKAFYRKAVEYIKLWDEIRASMLNHQRYAKLLVVGKIVIIQYNQYISCPALIVKTEMSQATGWSFTAVVFNPSEAVLKTYKYDYKISAEKEKKWYKLVSVLPNSTSAEMITRSHGYTVIQIKPENIMAIASEKSMRLSDVEGGMAEYERMKRSFKKNEFCEKFEMLLNSLSKYLSKCTGKWNVIDEKTVSFDDKELQRKVNRMWQLKDELDTYPVQSVPNKIEVFNMIFHWMDLKSQVEELKYKLSLESMSLYPDYLNKLDLLRIKEYVGENEQVELKGKMAGNVGKFELLITETLVMNILKDASCEEVAAIFSCLVCQMGKEEENDIKDDKDIPDSLKELVCGMQGVIKELMTLERDLGITEAEGMEYSKISFALVKPIYHWAKGMSFGEVMKMTVRVQEGAVVRYIQQLLEVLKDVESASKLMGDPRVPAVVEAASRSIKRGIVFSPSIYTTYNDESRTKDDEETEEDNQEEDGEEENREEDYSEEYRQEYDEEFEEYDDDRRAFY